MNGSANFSYISCHKDGSMKTSGLTFFFLYVLHSLPAQDYNPEDSIQRLNQSGNIIVQIAPGILTNQDYDPGIAGGFNLEYFVSRRVGFNGYLMIGKNTGHLNIGLVTLPLFMLLDNGLEGEMNSWEDLVIGLLLIVTVFENPSFHFPVNDRSDFTLSASPLRIRWMPETVGTNEPGTLVELAFAASLRYNLHLGRWVISPFGEVDFGYSGFKRTLSAGLWIGPKFYER